MGWDASEHMSAISGHQPMSVGFVERVTSGLRHCFVPDVLHGIYPRCFYSHSTVEAIHSVICSDRLWCLNYVSGQSCVNNRIFIIVLAEKQKEVLKTEQQIYPFGCRWLWAGGANLFNGSIIMETLPQFLYAIHWHFTSNSYREERSHSHQDS